MIRATRTGGGAGEVRKGVWIIADIKIFSETTRHFSKTCFDRNFCHLQFKAVQSTELNI